MALGKKLYTLRTAQNLTKEAVAHELGVSKTAYAKWENDLSKPSFDHISAICNFYYISKDELMEDDKSISQTNNSFHSSPNLINSPNPVFNYSVSNGVIQKITENQSKISELVENQSKLLARLLTVKA